MVFNILQQRLNKRPYILFEDSVFFKQCVCRGKEIRSQNWSFFVNVTDFRPLKILKSIEVYGNIGVLWIKFNLKKLGSDNCS